jgi:hypothetical protein
MAPKSNIKNILKVLIIVILVTALVVSSINVVAANDVNINSDTSEPENEVVEPISVAKVTDPELTAKLQSQYFGSELCSNGEQVLSSTPSLSGKTISKTGSSGSPRGEPDNNPNEANEIKHGDKNIEGDVTSQVNPFNPLDVDWYMIHMHEFGPVKTEYAKIKINNSNPPMGSDERIAVDVFETLYTFIWFNDNLQHSSRLDREIINTYEEKTVEFSSPITTMVFMLIYAIDGAKINYNITNVSVSMVQPSIDMNNHPGNATKPSSTSVNGMVNQAKDHWDWYDLSQYFTLEQNYTNNVTFTVDINDEGKDTNWFSWTEIWLFYDNKEGTQYNIYGGWGGSQEVDYSGGIPSEPISGWLNAEGVEFYLGIRTEAGFINNNQLYKLDTHTGFADYTLTFSVEHVDLNTKPTLTQGDVNPKVGTTSEYFTFEITYTDEDNDPPKYVNVTIDGTDYPMTPQSGGDYTTGKVYEKIIKGSTLTDYPYPHSYYFSAADYRATARFPAINFGDRQDLKVINNDPPYVLETAPDTLVIDEDDEVADIPLDNIFADPDGSTELEYEVWVGPEEDDYTINYESERLKVSFSSTLVRFKPVDNQHGEEEIRLRVSDTFTYTDFVNSITDTYSFLAFHNITVTINSINDAPNISPISEQTINEGDVFFKTISATDNDIATDSDTLTFITNVTDGMGTDDLPNFSIEANATNPITSADILFTPTNDNVGVFWVEIKVEDQAKASDKINLKFTVNNLNDKPEFITIGGKEYDPADPEINLIGSSGATQDEYFNITVVADDIDLDIGADDTLTFETNITDGYGNDDLDNFEIEPDPSNPKQALISFLPTNDDVGYLKFNLTVFDGKGGKCKTTVLIEIENVNDAPESIEIVNPRSGNVTFSMVETINFTGYCDDPDLHIPNTDEKLTFAWTSNVTDVKLGTGKTIFVDKLDRTFGFGYVTVTLTVIDKAGIVLTEDITIMITDDYDNDGIWDDWEVEFGLDYRNKIDANRDYDLDGFSNYEEFLGTNKKPDYLDDTNPYDAKDHPKEDSEEEDMSWLWMFIVVIVIIIVVLIIFGLLRKRKKEQEEEEEFFESMPASGAPPTDMGMGGGLPPPMMGAGTSPPPFMPPLPPASPPSSDLTSERSQFGGIRSSGLESTSAEDNLYLGPGESYADDISVSDSDGEDVKVWSPGAGSSDTGMKDKGSRCDTCGADVQAGWFICPSCKSPLRPK